MLVKAKQINDIGNVLQNVVLQNIVEYCSQKFPEAKLNLLSKEDRSAYVNEISNFASANKIVQSKDVLYFMYLCFKYNVDQSMLLRDSNIKENFTYPDRSINDKLFNFHYQLEFGNNG